MTKHTLHDDAGPFEVTVLEAPTPARVVLFAVGGGGDPARHLPLLEALRARGATVVAPHVERMQSPYPTAPELRLRAARLRRSIDLAPALPIAGVGHSIGGAMLLALAGAQAWTRDRERVEVTPVPSLARLAVMAPATFFFFAPGALDAVRVPIVAFGGTADALTPPSTIELLRQEIGARAPVGLRLCEGAGHFSFMHVPPPGTTEPLADRDSFLTSLVDEITAFVEG